MHRLKSGTFLTHIEVLKESPSQLRRKDHTTESGLSITLRRNQQRYYRVTIFPLGHHPLSHHVEEPLLEPSLPLRDVAGHASGEHRNMIRLPVPFVVAVRHIFIDRIDFADHIRVNKTTYIFVSRIKIIQTSFDSHTIDDILIARCPVLHPGVIGPILRIAHHLVVAEHISGFQKFDQFACLHTDRLTILPAFGILLGIDGTNDGTYARSIVYLLINVMVTDMDKGLLFWHILFAEFMGKIRHIGIITLRLHHISRLLKSLMCRLLIDEFIIFVKMIVHFSLFAP